MIYDDIEILNAEGAVINTIIATEAFAAQYAASIGCTWRHRPIFEEQPEG